MMAMTDGSSIIDERPEFDDRGRLVERPDPMTDGLGAAHWAVLALLARSNTPWVRRSVLDLAANRGVVDSLAASGHIELWVSGKVDEWLHEYRKDKDTGKQRQVGKRSTRGRPMTFASLTGLGQALMTRDVFERGDGGMPYQDRRRKNEKGEWVLPTEPIKSSGRGRGADPCPDLIPVAKLKTPARGKG